MCFFGQAFRKILSKKCKVGKFSKNLDTHKSNKPKRKEYPDEEDNTRNRRDSQHSPEAVEEIARDTGFVQRESKLGGMEFPGIMTQGLYSRPDATLNQMVSMGKDINGELKITANALCYRDIIDRLIAACMARRFPMMVGSFGFIWRAALYPVKADSYSSSSA